MKFVRLGLIGCGIIGQHHLQAAAKNPLIKIAAVADLREQLAKESAARFNIPRVYPDGKALLDDPDVEAVVLAMPAFVRTALALMAFARGKHVLTEKPVAMNADEVKRLIAARGKLVGACCSSRYRFLPSAKATADFIATGALGALRVIFCRAIMGCGKPPASPPPPWRLKKAMNGGGILMNWGCYDLDYLLGITGWKFRPKLALAQTWTVAPQFADRVAPGSDAETHFAALIRCADGAVISFERAEFAAAATEMAWRIVGTRGSLRLTMTGAKAKAIYHDDSTPDGVVAKTLWQGDDGSTTVHAGPVEDFAAAIREDRPPMTNLENALVMQQISDAIYASSEKGAAMEIQ